MTKFAFIVDAHYGFENRGGRKVALHDQKAIDCALAYVSDFKPDVLILGGDVLDCAVVSHHNKGKPGRVEGMRLYKDAEGCRQNLIEPL